MLRLRAVALPTDITEPRRDLGPQHARLPHAAALRLDRVVERVFPALAHAHPAVPLRIDLSRLEGLGYYPGLMLRVRLRGPQGAPPVIDGGFVPWTQALCADAKERMLASAIGTEFVCTQYSPPRSPA